jgi:hypothetical protein
MSLKKRHPNKNAIVFSRKQLSAEEISLIQLASHGVCEVNSKMI